MKFKVGDRVRLTREAIASKENRNYRVFAFEVIGVEVIGIKDDLVAYKYKDRCYGNEYEANLELVPEEPEFEYGEKIEVSTDNERWFNRIFITKTPNKVYVCVDYTCENAFINGRQFTTNLYKYARKLKPQLTRKEIAEKFGVSEDFTLIE